MDNVVPHLTEGLIDLCKKTPTDPVEYLSDFLLKRADLLDQQRIYARE
jgi:adenylate kinase